MKILIFGLNYAPELIGIGKYSGEMGAWFAGRGHDVRAICAPPYYPDWKVNNGYHAWIYHYETLAGVKVFRAPLYVPKKPNVLSRLIHLFSFAVTSTPLLCINLFWRPDIVITVAPTLFCAPGALLFSRLSGAKSVLHVQDFELDAMLQLGMGRNGVFSKLGFVIESWLMRSFDTITTISNSMVNKAKQKLGGAGQVVYFPNWVDVDFIKPGVNDQLFREKWGISFDTKVVIYSGNLGEKQGLEIILSAAERLSNKKNVLFLIIGAGSAKERLIEQSRILNLNNISFYPVQPYDQLPVLMALGDVFLVVQKKTVADAVLPSKVTTILAAGKNGLITAKKDTELGRLCTEFPGIAKRVPPENLEDLVRVLNDMLAEIDIQDRKINLIAREYAEKFLDKEASLKKFEEMLEWVAQPSKKSLET